MILQNPKHFQDSFSQIASSGLRLQSHIMQLLLQFRVDNNLFCWLKEYIPRQHLNLIIKLGQLLNLLIIKRTITKGLMTYQDRIFFSPFLCLLSSQSFQFKFPRMILSILPHLKSRCRQMSLIFQDLFEPSCTPAKRPSFCLSEVKATTVAYSSQCEGQQFRMVDCAKISSQFNEITNQGEQLSKSCSFFQISPILTNQANLQSPPLQTAQLNNQTQMDNLATQHKTQQAVNPIQPKGTPTTIHSISQNKSDSNSPACTLHRSYEPPNCQLDVTNEQIPKKLIKQKTQIIKGVYYNNRAHFFSWLRSQCSKYKLCRQTFANSICLMDNYFKLVKFNSNEFLKLALCMLIISSKSIETKVIYTSAIAANNHFEYKAFLEMEIEVLMWFKFRVNTYNFVRVVSQYMSRWDQKASLQQKLPLFLHQNSDSYVLFQETMYHCQAHLKSKRHLRKSDIQSIFVFLLSSQEQNELVMNIVDDIFQQPSSWEIHQEPHQYELLEQTNQQTGKQQDELNGWKNQFQKKIPTIKQRYSNQKDKYPSYSSFINILY